MNKKLVYAIAPAVACLFLLILAASWESCEVLKDCLLSRNRYLFLFHEYQALVAGILAIAGGTFALFATKMDHHLKRQTERTDFANRISFATAQLNNGLRLITTEKMTEQVGDLTLGILRTIDLSCIDRNGWALTSDEIFQALSAARWLRLGQTNLENFAAIQLELGGEVIAQNPVQYRLMRAAFGFALVHLTPFLRAPLPGYDVWLNLVEDGRAEDEKAMPANQFPDLISLVEGKEQLFSSFRRNLSWMHLKKLMGDLWRKHAPLPRS